MLGCINLNDGLRRDGRLDGLRAPALQIFSDHFKHSDKEFLSEEFLSMINRVENFHKNFGDP